MDSRTVQINGYYLNVMHQGQGQPVVLLHGWGSSWHHWELLIPHLVKAGYAVYAPDLYGHGNSAHPNNPNNYSIDVYYDSICKWLNAEGIERPFFISHSMGGYLSLKYTLDHPFSVPGLVFINPLLAPQQITAPPLFRSTRMAVLAENLLRFSPPWVVKSSLRFNPQDIESLSEKIQRQVILDYKRASPHIVRTLSSLKDMRPALKTLTVPTMLVWGDKDMTLKPGIFPELAAGIPNGQSYCFNGTYHAPHLAQSDRFAGILLPFVDRILLGDAQFEA